MWVPLYIKREHYSITFHNYESVSEYVHSKILNKIMSELVRIWKNYTFFKNKQQQYRDTANFCA